MRTASPRDRESRPAFGVGTERHAANAPAGRTQPATGAALYGPADWRRINSSSGFSPARGAGVATIALDISGRTFGGTASRPASECIRRIPGAARLSDLFGRSRHHHRYHRRAYPPRQGRVVPPYRTNGRRPDKATRPDPRLLHPGNGRRRPDAARHPRFRGAPASGVESRKDRRAVEGHARGDAVADRP